MALKFCKLLFLLSFSMAYTSSAFSLEDEKSLYKNAISYFYRNKLEMAELLFQDVLKKYPENQKAYSYLGDIFLQKKRYDGALKLYKRSLELNPSNGEDYFRIGQVYYYKKQGNLAIENFKKSFELDPTIKYAYYHIGITYLIVLRDKKNTIDSMEKYLKIAPEDPQYEKIRRVVELLRDPSFVIPPVGSNIPIEEALHLGGDVLKRGKHRTKDMKAGHEKKKTKDTIEDIKRDDGL